MSRNLDLDALQHLADALTEDIVNTPGGTLLSEVLEDFGSTHALADEFDKTFDRAAQQATKEQLEARAGHESLDRLVEFKIEDILSASGDQLLDEVAEDHGNPHALAAEFDAIVRPIMSSHSNRSVQQSDSIAATDERAAASVSEWLRSLWQKSLTLLVDTVFPNRVAVGAISLACLLLIAVFAVRPTWRDDVIALRPSAPVKDSATLTSKDGNYDPASAKTADDVGNAEYAKGNLDSARQTCDNLRSDPDDRIPGCTRLLESGGKDINIGEIYSVRANAWYLKGNFDNAIADYQSALNHNPKLGSALQGLGDSYFRKAEFRSAIKSYSDALTIERKSAELYNNRGLAQLNVGDFRSAVKDFGEAIKINPKFSFAYNNRGIAYSKYEQFEPAIRDFTKAIKIRGETLRENGALDKAIADYDQAIRLDPKYADAYNNRGEAYLKKGDADHAIADFNRAIELTPGVAAKVETPAAVAPRATVQPTVNKLEPPQHEPATASPVPPRASDIAADPVIQNLDQAIAANPNDATALYKRGQLYARRRNFPFAIRDFDEVLRLRPKDPEALNNRCWARAILGDLQTALRDCNEALQIRPRYADAFDSRGFVNLKIGQSSRAIADYDTALRINPKQASSLYGRGIAKLKTGNSADAMRDIAAANTLQPNIAEEFATFGITEPNFAGSPF